MVDEDKNSGYSNERNVMKFVPLDNDRFKFITSFEAELSRTQMKKNKDSIKQNVKSLNSLIKPLLNGDELEAEKKKQDKELKDLKKFIDNFDEEYDKHVQELIDNKEIVRQEQKDRLNNIGKEHEKRLTKIASTTIKNIELYNNELDDNKKNLKLYEDALNENNKR